MGFPDHTCPIDWEPDPFQPVFAGLEDYEFRTPGPCRVFFPNEDWGLRDADILKGCGGYPLVLFAHGECLMDTEHYKEWMGLPVTLARAGFVVAVPEIPHGRPPLNNTPGLNRIKATINWVRECWRHRDVLLSRPKTGILGHSRGAILAARYAAENEVSAYAAIGGEWHPSIEKKLNLIGGEDFPKLFGWGTRDVYAKFGGPHWDPIHEPKHKVTFAEAGHWDYLGPTRSACGGTRGSCWMTDILVRNILVMFLGRYLTRDGPPPSGDIPASLIPPELPPELELPDEHSFYRTGYLLGFDFLDSEDECKVTSTWETETGAGMTTLPE